MALEVRNTNASYDCASLRHAAASTCAACSDAELGRDGSCRGFPALSCYASPSASSHAGDSNWCQEAGEGVEITLDRWQSLTVWAFVWSEEVIVMRFAVCILDQHT